MSGHPIEVSDVDAQSLPAAKAFLDWLIGTCGQAILASFGFLPPPS